MIGSRLAFVVLGLFGCGAARTHPDAPAPVCNASSIASTPTTIAPSSAPPPTPQQVCERVRTLVVSAGAKSAGVDDAIQGCIEDLVELRAEQPESYRCAARCLMIVPGFGADAGCEELCDAHAADDCGDMRNADATVSDVQIAACRDRIARLQASTDDRTTLCALACESMAENMRAMDECFTRCF